MAKAAWEKDAEDFGRRFRFGEWDSALRVARSVVLTGPGRVEKLRSVARTTSEKALVSDFAETADVAIATVRRYYKTWALASKEGLVPSADELVPGGGAIDLPETHLWEGYYRRANPKASPTKAVSREQDADVAMLGALSDANDDLDVAVESSDYAKLSERTRASAEVLCRGAEEKIAAIRQRTQPDELDVELQALTEGVS